ncbi:amidohydrolase [Polluticaenibacter yanchengensis]|uniref:Amidohydrolase n=1 Tax=Polluticaenibacter yanchengensis TaxID=3014562 RepID=A0ABT4UMB9_9BACT|nr:amidohydrolase [Chitinophagaceae bacterium LY-5]
MRHKLFYTALSFLIVISGKAQLQKLVKQLAYNDSARLVTIFKDLHANPELAFMETRTADIVQKELKALGYETQSGIAKTGVVAVLKNGAGPVVLYRADMDCNAVEEVTPLEYASKKRMKNAAGVEVPVMHACGHDAHITWMLGVAKIMAEMKNHWKGTLIFVAQPAEETGSGAKAMIKDGFYDKGIPVPDYLFGMHTIPLAVGKIDNAVGVRMAGTDQINVTFKGVGGHGASPEFTKDPVVMGSNAVMQYQTIISRNIGAQDVGVLTVGAFQAGNSNNVIPASALLKLNLRWFNEATRNTLINGIKQINKGIAVANNLPEELYPDFDIAATAIPLNNHEVLTTRLNTAFEKVLGKENVLTNRPAFMPSEDFQYFAMAGSKTVYNYTFVGIANKDAVKKANASGKEFPFFNHNGNFEVDLSAIPLGTEIGVTAVMELLKIK